MAKGLEEAVEENLSLAFFVSGDVGLGPLDEGGEFFDFWIGHVAGDWRGAASASNAEREWGCRGITKQLHLREMELFQDIRNPYEHDLSSCLTWRSWRSWR